MNQDPPILQPIDDKEFYNSLENHSNGLPESLENCVNGYINNNDNGTSSPTMPILYQADKEPTNMFNIQDIFSVLANDEFDQPNTEYQSKLTPRKESDSFFEKIYKDYSTTLTNSIVQDSTKDSTTSPQETIESELNHSKPELEPTKPAETIIDKTSPEKSVLENNTEDSKKPPRKSEIAKKTRKRKPKKPLESIINDEELKKLGITKTIPGKKDPRIHKSNVTIDKSIQSKEINSANKYLKSPFITLRKGSPKKPCQTVNVISSEYEIINPALRGNADYQISIYRPNIKSLGNGGNQCLAPHQCICVFCGRTSEFLKLGSLYGPYFVESDSIHGLPLTCLFPGGAGDSLNQNLSVVGASGKSAIKADKNGGLKMVIQSTRSGGGRGSAGAGKKSEKPIVEDYRITWDGEVWFHRECILWAPCTFLRGDGKIGGLEEALKMALNAECCVCHKIGAILNCTTKNCDKNFHYYCAITLDSKLNHEQFSLLCNKHKEKC